MPYRTEWVDPEVFMEHNGVTIYHVYKNDEVDEVRFCTFGTSTYASDQDTDHSFDVRDLPNPLGLNIDEGWFGGNGANTKALIVAAIEAGIVKDTTPEETP